MSDEELDQKFAAIGRVARHLMLQIMKDRAEQLALSGYLRNSGLIDEAKLQEERRKVDAKLHPIFEKLEKPDGESATDALLEILVSFRGPVQ